VSALRKLIVTGLGTGYLPVAPGTWGSAAVAGLFLLTVWGSGGRWYCVNGTLGVIVVAASIGCVALGRFAERIFGKKDPGQVSLDEWAGQAVTYLFLPVPFAGREMWAAGIVGFLAFRMLDIVKLPPARQSQALPAGWGILVDDLIAGVQANIVTQIVVRLLI